MAAKKPLNLFIDTNVLLGFYRYTKDDLEKLSELEDLIIKTKDVNHIATSQQVDEFYRNRDKVIVDAVKELKTTISIPKLFSGHKDYKKIKKQASMIRAEVERVQNETLLSAKDGKLKADKIIARLFKGALAVDDETITKATQRMAVGNPPGKNGSVGDAINWELLLKTIPVEEDLHIVSQDGDFSSALDKNKLNSFLQREWNSSRVGKVYFYETLNALFKAQFQHITLMGEYVKDDLIRQLGQSRSFDDSRDIIEKMIRMGSFSEKQVSDIYDAATKNYQVYGAHEYSPELVGEKLWQIVKPHWHRFGDAAQDTWMEAFPEHLDPEEIIPF